MLIASIITTIIVFVVLRSYKEFDRQLESHLNEFKTRIDDVGPISAYEEIIKKDKYYSIWHRPRFIKSVYKYFLTKINKDVNNV